MSIMSVPIGYAVFSFYLLQFMNIYRDQRRESLTCLVFSIICRPYAVTLDEIAKHGSLPTVAPVKPYTELALI